MLSISVKDLSINDEIRAEKVRLIDAAGNQMGIVDGKNAKKMAYDSDMDLVMIAPNAEPPVCRIMDYGKYRFEQIKHEKEARKNQKVVEVKEVRLSLNIDVHDFDTKVKHAVKFLSAGDRVKVSIRFRGRELGHTSMGYPIMQRFADACAEVSSIDKPSKMEGRQMFLFLSPKASK